MFRYVVQAQDTDSGEWVTFATTDRARVLHYLRVVRLARNGGVHVKLSISAAAL